MNRAHRVVRSIRPASVVTPQTSKRLSTAPPPPPPQPESKSSNTPLILTVLAALGGLGYYYTREEYGKNEDIQKKARELEQAVRAKTDAAIGDGKAKVDEAKATGKAQANAVESRLQQTYNSAVQSVNSVAHESKEKLDAAAASTRSSIDHARESTTKQLHEAEKRIEETKEAAKSSWWSWFGWGKAKGEEVKSGAAKSAEKVAADVKKGAEDIQDAAAKRA